MKNLSEAELIVLAQSGNARAMSALLEKYRSVMLRSMKSKFSTTSVDTIEDCVQDGLTKSFIKIGKYNPVSSFNSWLTKICYNTIIDYTRKNVNKHTHVSIDHNNYSEEDDSFTLSNLLSDEGLNPQELMEKEDKANLLINIIGSSDLSEEIKTVAELRFIDELSYDEIVEKTGYKLGTVKTRISRFREASMEKYSVDFIESVY